MKLKNISAAFGMLFLAVPSHVEAGGVGGSGPPAKEDLQLMLMSADGGAAGLFKSESGAVSLGVNRTLNPDLVLSRSKSSMRSLTISESDFESLSSTKTRTIDAVTVGAVEPETRSYVIEDGDRLGELVLKDRREAMRAALK
ncbi:MAG TPA: hypothetical protein V6C65_10530 [Allocoleopsis sp.]